jgi:hypothetical protein
MSITNQAYAENLHSLEYIPFPGPPAENDPPPPIRI